MNADRLKQITTGAIAYDKDFIPWIASRKLVSFMHDCDRFPDIKKSFFEEAIHVGALTYLRQGNYSVQSLSYLIFFLIRSTMVDCTLL